jgi:hypothetical protein
MTFCNYSLPPLPGTRPLVPGERLEPAPGIKVAIEPDMGFVDAYLHEGYSFAFRDVSKQAGWMEMGLAIGGAPWVECSALYLQFTINASVKTQVRPTLRYLQSDGFHDQFAKDWLTIGPEESGHTCHFSLCPAEAAQARSLDLHLFFAPGELKFTLSELVITGTP